MKIATLLTGMPKKLRYACLFSGIGAPLQGAYRVYGKENIEHVFSCEFDKFARQSFEENYDIEAKHFHKDVNDLDATQYKDQVDILIGGSPCQAFSLAGLRHGTEDERGQLIYQYIRVVDECRPEIIVYENVKGIMSIDGGRTIKDFVQALRDIGYYCHYDVVNTKDYGVPQNRERLFLVGFLNVDHYHRFDFAPKIPLEKRLKDVLEDDVDQKYYLSDKAVNFFKQNSINNEAKGNGFRFSPSDGSTYAKALTTLAGSRMDDNFVKVVGMLDIKGKDQIKRVYDQEGLSPTLTTMQGGHQEPKIQVKSATKQGYETATTGDSINLSVPNSKTRRGRVGKQVAQCLDTSCNQAVVAPKINVIGSTGGGHDANSRIYGTDGISPSLMAGNNGGGQSPVKHLTQDYRIRKLTERECLRLQDFPDTFIQVVSASQMYKQAGNSMSVNILEMIFNQIEKAKTNESSGSLMDFI